MTPNEPAGGGPGGPGGVTTFKIQPGSLYEGKVNTSYDFILEATGLPSDMKVALVEWSFMGGANGQKAVQVVNGSASWTVSQRYVEAGGYGLVASIAQPMRANTFKTLATDRVVIGIGVDPVREQELLTCDGWQSANSGGYGGTIDVWDISGVPTGAVFDLRFDTYQIPDMLIIDYPVGLEVHNTGWRGLPRYDGDSLYPGGVDGLGQGEVEGVFTKADANEFMVTVFGPDPNTAWKYDVRCTAPAE